MYQRLVLLIFLIIGNIANAHPVWIKPSAFTVSTESGEWLSFDVSASHTLFEYDKPVPLDELKVFSPNGDRNVLGQYFKGQRRSGFDYEINHRGTFRFALTRPPFYFTSYKSGKRDTPKRMMANKQQAAERLPKNARDVKTLLIDMGTSSYVTMIEPTDLVLQTAGKGLEIQFQTHPSDIVVDEEVMFTLLLNGKPAKGVEVELTPGGTRYRDDRKMQHIVTSEDGRVNFAPSQAGPWYLSAVLTAETQDPMADEAMMIHYITFEVIPE